MGFCRKLWIYKQTVIIILTPLLLAPLPAVIASPEAKCAYIILIMGVYWLTESLPMGVTSLIPVVLFPVLRIMPSSEVCKNYMGDTILLFIGGLVAALAIEKVNLHKRIALKTLLMVGSDPKWLIFGFMAPTGFLSMWISNTASTCIMIPIANAVMDELQTQEKHKAEILVNNKESDLENDVKNDKQNREEHDQNQQNHTKVKEIEAVCKGLTLCIAYAANIGGTATFMGTPPNLVFKGHLAALFGVEFSFTSWLVFATPTMIILLFCTWLWLQFMFLGWRSLLRWRCRNPHQKEVLDKIVRREYESLGRMSFAEWSAFLHFFILTVLWITRDTAWSRLFKDKYVSDTQVAIFVVISLFIWPMECPNLAFWKKSKTGDDSGVKTATPIMDWRCLQMNIPWNAVLLFGGGFTIAAGCQKSGFSYWMGRQLSGLQNIPNWATLLIICLMVAGITEIASNTATSNIILPILAELAVTVGVSPLYFMIPATITASFAFMLPVATPPNAVVFAFGKLTVKDMVKTGFFLNIMCIVILNIAVNTYGKAYFKFDIVPDWAKHINKTVVTDGTYLTSTTSDYFTRS